MTVVIRPISDRFGDLIAQPKGQKLDAKQVEMLEFCNRLSTRVWAGYANNELLCVWGLIPPSLLSNQAYLWMHSTDAIRDHTFIIARYSQLVIEEMLKRYETIVGHCRVGEARANRWLRWLGATFGPAEPGGVLPFVIRRKGLNG